MSMAFRLNEVAPCPGGCLVPNFVASKGIQGVIPWNEIREILEEFSADGVAANFIEHVAEVEFEDCTWRAVLFVSE